MRITSIETYQLRCPLEIPFGWSQGRTDHRSVGILKVNTDEGITGWGEGCEGPAAAVVERILEPMLKDRDPMNRIGLWQMMFDALYNANVAVGFGGSAISAVDTEAETISIIPDGETEAIVLNVNPQTEITLDSEEATLDELGEGNTVTASYYLKNFKATQIDAESPPE